MGAEGPIRLLVGFSRGSVSNIVARLLAPALEAALQRPLQIVQLPGDNGALAARQLAQAAPDGATLGMAVPTHLIGSLLGGAHRYDPLADFSAVGLIARNPMVLAVNNELGVDSVAGLIELARARPGQLAYGASALGGGPHLGSVLFGALAGIRLQRRLYAETGVLFDDLSAGRIALTFNNPTSVLQASRLGRLTMLAVTGSSASPLVPGVPALAASGVPGFEFTSWVGLLAPAGIPAPRLAHLHDALSRATASAEVTRGLHELGLEPQQTTPAQFSAHLHREFRRWLAFVMAHRQEFPDLREDQAASGS